MNSRKLYEAFNYVDDWYLDIVDAPAKETTNMKSPKQTFSAKRFFSIALAAAFCVSILAVTAMAAGWIPNIFASVDPVWEEDAKILEEVLQVTQEPKVESFSAPELDFTQFTLYERYYDGEKILLGYDKSKVMPEPIVGFQPDEALLAQIMESDIEGQEAVVYPPLEEKLSQEQYEQFQRILSENGVCCVAIPSEVYVADHIWVNDADCGEVLSPTCGNFRSDYTTEFGDCIILTPLPEAGRNQDTVTVKLNLRSGWDYWYVQSSGNILHTYVPNPAFPITVTIENVNK